MITLDKKFPEDIFFYKDGLMILHTNYSESANTCLGFYDLKKGVEHTVPLEYKACQMELLGKELYVMSDDKIYKYDADSFELIDSVDALPSRNDNYVSSFFVY